MLKNSMKKQTIGPTSAFGYTEQAGQLICVRGPQVPDVLHEGFLQRKLEKMWYSCVHCIRMGEYVAMNISNLKSEWITKEGWTIWTAGDWLQLQKRNPTLTT